MACMLIRRCGDIAHLLRNAEAFVDHPQVRDLLMAVDDYVGCALRSEMQSGPVITGSEALMQYLKYRMAHLRYEQVRALYLDAVNRVVGDNVVAKGSVSSCSIHSREIIRRAFELQAVGIILVHNHPSGVPMPSNGDIAATNKLLQACKAVELSLLDHIVISKQGWTSFKMEGLIS